MDEYGRPDGCVKPFNTLHETSGYQLMRRYYYKDMPRFQREWMAAELSRTNPKDKVSFRVFDGWQLGAGTTENITEVTVEKSIGEKL